MADLLTSAVRDRPVIVQYWGSDLLGSHTERGLRRLSVQAGVLASRRAAGRAAAVIVVSEGLRAALPLRAAAGNVWVVPGGIDLERFRPLDQHDCQLNIGWDEGRKHVLFPSSSQRPEKRYALAQAAVERLRGEFQADLHELDGVPHSDVATWMNASDVVLLTSTHEGSPNAVKEALACNVPVVAVDVGDVRERLVGVDGSFLAEPTVADLTAKLRLVLLSGQRTNSRPTLADFSLKRIAERLREIYQVVIERETGRQAGATSL